MMKVSVLSASLLILLVVAVDAAALPVTPCMLSKVHPFTAEQLVQYVDIWYHNKDELTRKEKVKRMVDLERGMTQEQLEAVAKLRNALISNADCAPIDREKTMRR